MSDNFKKIYNGISLEPQSSDPSNPQEGDVFYSDGTARDKGVWHYDGTDWVQPTGGGGASPYLIEQTLDGINSSANSPSSLHAQSFTLASPSDITAVEFVLSEQSAGYSGGLIVKLYSVTDVNTFAGKSLIATSDTVNSTTIVSKQFYKFNFTGVTNLPAGGYLAELDFAAMTFVSPATMNIWVDSNPYADGTWGFNNTPNLSFDMAFKIEGSEFVEAGANKTLSNLDSPTAINTSLLPASGTATLGSNSAKWNKVTTGLGGYRIYSNSSDYCDINKSSDTPNGNNYYGLKMKGTSNVGIGTDNIDLVGGVASTGNVYIESGRPQDGNGGSIIIEAGEPQGSGTRGEINLKTEADKTKLDQQPTGADELAVATTKYVDDAKSQWNEEIFTLTATDASNGYVDLQTEAFNNSEIVWKDDNNGPKFRGTDFTTALNGTQTRVSFLAPFNATAGDKVAVNYVSSPFVPVGTRSAVWTQNSTYGFLSSTFGLNLAQFTFAAWIYIPSSSSGINEIFSAGRTTAGNGVYLWEDGTGNLNFDFVAKTCTISGLTRDTWHHVACILNTSTGSQYNFGTQYMRVYLNGVESAPQTGGGGDLADFDNQVIPSLGGGTSNFFDGSFANAHAWYNQALTPADITALFSAGYYDDENAIIGKAADHKYLFGDLGQAPADTTTVIYDRIGTNDIDFNFGGNPARNLDSFSTNAP